MLTGGQVADCTAGAQLLERLPPCRILHGDKGYDTNAIRHQIEQHGAMPNIPPKASRRWKNCFSPILYRGRNAIERMFCRLKDFRRVPFTGPAIMGEGSGWPIRARPERYCSSRSALR